MSFCAALSVEEDEAEIIKRNGNATQPAASGLRRRLQESARDED